LTREVGRDVCLRFEALKVLIGTLTCAERRPGEVRVPDDGREQVVEVQGDAPSEETYLLELLTTLKTGPNHLGVDLPAFGDVGGHPDQTGALVLFERRDGDLERTACMAEFVVATTEIRDGMQRSDCESAGRDVTGQGLANGRLAQTEKLRALAGHGDDTKLVIGRPDRPGKVPHEHAEFFAGAAMLGALSPATSTLGGKTTRLWIAFPSPLARKLVEQA